jgi:prepilin-type N-terminal cleavage/methylation domain-containing protein
MVGRLPCRADIRACVVRSTTAFTLVELMVVLVIVALLASLTLAGLSGVRQRAKEDKTRSTIRKIDSVIQSMYESYATRRVAITIPPATLLAAPQPRRLLAINRLENLRLIMAVEMPDTWNDVGTSAAPLTIPAWSRNVVYRRYSAYKTALSTAPGSNFNIPVPNFTPPTTYGQLYGYSETLLMIVSMSGFQPDCMEQFRPDEIGDIDRDGAKEFSDGWGRPIAFIRWPAGFASPFINHSQPDPVDVMRVTGPITLPFAAQSDWAMTPLIYSAGPDEATNDPFGAASGYGLFNPGPSWLASLPIASTCQQNPAWPVSNGAVNPANPAAVSDNITNYDLLTK